jgi:Uncharacterized protein conserved in bacteria
MDFSLLISNKLINAGVVSWVTAQVLKTIIDLIKNKHFNRKRLSGAGGMPSSHSAITCSLMLTTLLEYDFQSPYFAITFILAIIVMYDAAGVRYSAGLHAQSINRLVNHFSESEDMPELQELIPDLNESLGHRLIEVICGALLGFSISLILYFVI